MISKQKIEDWLANLPADSGVSIYQSGLTSQCGAYLEVGGEPEPDAPEFEAGD